MRPVVRKKTNLLSGSGKVFSALGAAGWIAFLGRMSRPALGSSTGIDLKHGVSSVSRNGAACFSLGTKPDHGGRD